MSDRNNILKNELLKNRIETSDTISQFMEKCNNNFSIISEFGGGPAGSKGEDGSQGVPTKPKVPIHVWKKTEGGNDNDYTYEESTENGFEIEHWYNDLSDNIYQDGHLVILENGHVYMLSADDNFELKPKYIFSMQSYDQDSVIDGKESYVDFSYTNDIESFDGFITDNQIRKGNVDDIYNTDRAYIGVYCDHTEKYSDNPYSYTWTKIKGKDGIDGKDGISSSLLNTSPNLDGNKVIVSGNSIKVLSDDGTISTIISSNEITQDKLNRCETWDETNNNIYKPSTFNFQYNDYQNISSVESSYIEIGFLNTEVEVLINSFVSISKNDIFTNENDIIKNNYWNIIEDCFKLCIEKYNTTNRTWDVYETQTIGSSEQWLKCDSLGNISDVVDYGFKKCEFTFETSEEGVYRFKTIIDEYGISSIIQAKSIRIATKGEVNNKTGFDNEEIKYTEIGKNGIIVKSGIAGEGDDSTLFYVYPGEILMEVGNFGIKIDKYGIYRKTDGEWLNWE
jgi:hypothetical protein